jgi:hypothetical protein
MGGEAESGEGKEDSAYRVLLKYFQKENYYHV